MPLIVERYDRNIRLFGKEGQRTLRKTKVVIVGIGGLGSPLAQHMALLGVGQAALVDHEDLDDTNRNRFVGSRHDDPVPGSPKVRIAGRLIREINPDVDVVELQANLVTAAAFGEVKAADWVFGCFDHDGPRFILNELCAAYRKPYIDLASDVPEAGVYGGRVCTAFNGNGCLNCFGLLDELDVRSYLSSEEETAAVDAIYGVPRDTLGDTGPSVSPVNGVVASLAATEFMVAVTGMRLPTPVLTYRGEQSKVLVSTDKPASDCYYCEGIRNKGIDADVERYLKLPQFDRP